MLLAVLVISSFTRAIRFTSPTATARPSKRLSRVDDEY
nr:MAG TPA: hypothetical protein [Caudoviricetes sp.]